MCKPFIGALIHTQTSQFVAVKCSTRSVLTSTKNSLKTFGGVVMHLGGLCHIHYAILGCCHAFGGPLSHSLCNFGMLSCIWGAFVTFIMQFWGVVMHLGGLCHIHYAMQFWGVVMHLWGPLSHSLCNFGVLSCICGGLCHIHYANFGVLSCIWGAFITFIMQFWGVVMHLGEGGGGGALSHSLCNFGCCHAFGGGEGALSHSLCNFGVLSCIGGGGGGLCHIHYAMQFWGVVMHLGPLSLSLCNLRCCHAFGGLYHLHYAILGCCQANE